MRVPGLPIRDCAGSCNRSEHMRTTVSAVYVTAKAFFERLYLVSGLSPFEPRVKCPCAPTPPPFAKQLFLDFCEIFSPEWPLNFFVITIHQVIWTSPGTRRGGQGVNIYPPVFFSFEPIFWFDLYEINYRYHALIKWY